MAARSLGLGWMGRQGAYRRVRQEQSIEEGRCGYRRQAHFSAAATGLGSLSATQYPLWVALERWNIPSKTARPLQSECHATAPLLLIGQRAEQGSKAFEVHILAKCVQGTESLRCITTEQPTTNRSLVLRRAREVGNGWR